jgi:hypothetical protein
MQQNAQTRQDNHPHQQYEARRGRRTRGTNN